MAAICLSVAIMTAGARSQLLIGSIVVAILSSVIVHNALGLALGYWFARLFGWMKEAAVLWQSRWGCRTAVWPRDLRLRCSRARSRRCPE